MFEKISKPFHVGIHWIALAESFQMSTHLPGFQSCFRFLHHLVLAKLATSSIRVKDGLEGRMSVKSQLSHFACSSAIYQ